MPKNSKRQRRLERRAQDEAEQAKRLERKRTPSPSVATLSTSGSLSPKVALNQNILEEGDQKYQITFRDLNIDACDFCALDRTKTCAFLKKFKDIADQEPRHASRDRVFRDNIHNSGEYARLFQGLTPDVTLKEIEFANEGRIFCFTVQHHLSVVAIWTKHANLH